MIKKEHIKVGIIAVVAVFLVRTLANRAAGVPLVGQVAQIAANGL